MRWPERLIDTMRARPVRAAAAVLAAMLAGCTTTALTPPAPAPAPAAAPAAAETRPQPRSEAGKASLMDELARLRALPSPDLAVETQKLLDAADGRLRLTGAIALALPQHPARDEARAVALAEEIAQRESSPLRDLAAAVALWLDEQRRAEAAGRRAQTKAREDEARLALTEARLRDMERRAQEAEKKLEALRAIERELSGRGSGNGR